MKLIAERVFGAAALLLLTMVSVSQGFRGLSAPSDLGVIGGMALLAMTVSAWSWVVIHYYYLLRGKMR